MVSSVRVHLPSDAWFESGKPQEPKSARKHSLPDGFAFVGSGRGEGNNFRVTVASEIKHIFEFFIQGNTQY